MTSVAGWLVPIAKGEIAVSNAMAKLGRNEDVRVGVLEKICLALDCKFDDDSC